MYTIEVFAKKCNKLVSFALRLPISFLVIHAKVISTFISWHMVESSNRHKTKQMKFKKIFEMRGFCSAHNKDACLEFSMLFEVLFIISWM